MYLKRLELQGFKSFRNKTVFDFGDGMTAVVGPNGSGKSNVAESLRWVLGEPTSSRGLRARRLEDVIFSGSSQRAAVGMAEVSITLDNTDGWLPLDFSEVVVSRRAFRNGESEYLINKARVRLRDVLDLFLRSQVGQNSYAFMGQGLVEEVLVMRPEERRRLLEEAADVRLLRTRLDEARDRLSATRENLERVNLLLDEIGPRLAQLERQASRAGQHSVLAAELADTLRALFSLQWNEAQEALTVARSTYDQRQQAFTVARDDAQALDGGLTALSAALEERERELTTRRQRQRALADEVHTLEQRLGFGGERIDAQLRRRTELETEIESLRGERSEMQGSLDEMQARVNSIIPDIETAQRSIDTRREEMNALEQEHAAARRRVSEREDALARTQRTLADVEAQLGRIRDDESRSVGEVQRQLRRRAQILEGLTEIGRDYRETGRRLAEIDSELSSVDSRRETLADSVDSNRGAVINLENENLQVESRLIELRARIELLRRLQAAEDGIDSGSRFLFGDEDDEGRYHAVEGLVGLIRDIVRVPPGLERAIEAALTDNVQALVFENQSTALAAIDLLEDREAGKALIYPLDTIKASPPLNLLREKGIVGVAARLVRCEGRFRPLVDAILGRTIVVETTRLAQQVLRRGLGSVVTLEGVLLRPNGAIAGGQTRAAAEAFTRRTELEELPEEVERVESHKFDIESRLQRAHETLESASVGLTELESSVQSMREERVRLQNQMLENRGKLILLRGDARVLWTEVRRDYDLAENEHLRATLIAERERLHVEASTHNEALEREREALAALQPRRTSAVDALAESAAAHADLNGESRSHARQMDMLQTSVSRIDIRLHDREALLAQLDASLQQLRGTSSSEEGTLLRQREELDALSAEMEPAEGELSHLQNREREMRDQLASARTHLLDTERAHLEAEAAMKLRSDELEALRETIIGEGFRPDGGGVVPIDMPPEMTRQPSETSEQTSQPGLPPVRGGATLDAEALRQRIAELRVRIRGLGPVNEEALADYGENKERYDFLKGQVDDLTSAEQTLLGAIEELEENVRERLKETFAIVDREFQRYFEAFFNGGSAHLSATNPDDFANSGIDIVAQPPGKRVNTLAMLSGGERALTALALLLSLLEAHPSPICVLDEVDAALDETNVGRFVDALTALEKKTQFIVITHNARTVEAADSIYGVAMGKDSVSQVLSLRLDDIANNN